MKPVYSIGFVLLLALFAACDRGPALLPGTELPLASFSENGVTVEIVLQLTTGGETILAATFIPEQGWHLYSMDLISDSVGRPTLLEIPASAQMQAAGELTESVAAAPFSSDDGELLVYPQGPVTLSIVVILPSGSVWIDDQVLVTYMACSDSACRAPVVGRLVPLRVPGMGLLP
ncbi:MAG: hypothetical protein ABIJ39_09050 [Chloroflexota bacterium]